MVVELAPTLAYRGGVRARRVDEDSAELAFEAFSARVRIVERDGELELWLAMGAERPPEVPEPPSGWRAWWGRVAPWASAMVGPNVRAGGRDARGAWVRISLDVLPEARVVLAWLRALGERLGGD